MKPHTSQLQKCDKCQVETAYTYKVEVLGECRYVCADCYRPGVKDSFEFNGIGFGGGYGYGIGYGNGIGE